MDDRWIRNHSSISKTINGNNKRRPFSTHFNCLNFNQQIARRWNNFIGKQIFVRSFLRLIFRLCTFFWLCVMCHTVIQCDNLTSRIDSNLSILNAYVKTTQEYRPNERENDNHISVNSFEILEISKKNNKTNKINFFQLTRQFVF